MNIPIYFYQNGVVNNPSKVKQILKETKVYIFRINLALLTFSPAGACIEDKDM